MKKLKRLLPFLVLLCGCSLSYTSEITEPAELPEEVKNVVPVLPPPVYVCQISNINDYQIFANAGWDGNWYIGYNVCWIEQLSLSNIPDIKYRKAFIGAKIGRAKTRTAPGKPSWEKEPIPGEIYIGISSTPAWKSSQRYFLASAEDMPLEADFENALEGTGESRWFWREVPLEQVNFNGPNYIALWSPTDYFISRDTAPILCGGWGARNAEKNTWLNDEISGVAPMFPESSLKTPISVFEPAIAMKLIPAGTERQIPVNITAINESNKNPQDKIIFSTISAPEIERSWLEVSEVNEETGQSDWKKTSKYLYNPPYIFTMKANGLPTGKVLIRIACADIWSNKGYSQPIEFEVKR